MNTDQTGRFSVVSSKGNKYLMIAVEMDGNYIDGKPMNTRESQSLVKAYQSMWERWKVTGAVSPNWHMFLTLNLLRQSNVAPNVSAYAYHRGQFDYDRMPLAPLGCAVQFHVKLERRKSWGEDSADGYVRTSPEHYRCHEVFVKATKSKRITDTVFFKHKYITQPTVTPADAIV